MNSKLLAVIMITGLLFSAGSVFLNHVVFADDSQSDITARQQASEQKAIAKTLSMYQYANMSQSQRDWSGLGNSITTDETSRGRDIAGASQVSAQNAVSQFDVIHVRQLADLASNQYKNLTDTTTDTQGRDRTAMIDNARAVSDVNAQSIIDKLVKIQQTYNDFAPSTTTNTAATYDRQTQINQNMAASESAAADLVNQLAKLDQVYIDLSQYVNTDVPYTFKAGSITNEMTHGGRNLTPQEAYSLSQAVMIFNQIHQTHLAALKSSYYGLTSTTTDTQGRDRNQMLAQAQQLSLDNALRVFTSYYPASTR